MPVIKALKWLNAKEVLGGEASHFTPWLAENLDLLGTALGLTDIALVETESDVQGKSLDILATGTDQDGQEFHVVIENQYGETDHKHLGQLVSYLAQYGEGYAVWVTETYSAAHSAAIEFLNRTSPENVNYFLVQVRFAAGPEGSYQVYFELVVRPNTFVKGRRSRNGVSERPVNSERRDYLASVLEIAKPRLEAAGFKSVRMHARGSYIQMRLPIQSLDSVGAELKFYVTKSETIVRLHFYGLDSREKNAAALEVLRARYEGAWERALPDLPEYDWHGGAPNAASDFVGVVLSGVGYKGGAPRESADWAVRVAEEWLKPLQANPIVDLEMEADKLLENSGGVAE